MEDVEEKKARGRGRGSNFFALGLDVWDKLQTLPTSNRLNLILTYLVLLAGTGSDHRLTKWSAKACEEHLGMGKPRAKTAIEELIAGGLVSRTEKSTRMMPQYQLPELDREADPIFLPVQLVIGLARETPVLRRVRETGDLQLLVMLIDLYSLIETDATHGVPISHVRQINSESSARKVAEAGVYAIWGLSLPASTQAWQQPWSDKHIIPGKPKADWKPLWERLEALKKIGAIWWEPWVFDSDADDAEPLFPVDPGAMSSYAATDADAELTLTAFRACYALLGERTYQMDSVAADIFIPLMVHQQQPALRGVLRLRVEADTPGRRRAYGKRCSAVEQYQAAFALVTSDAEADKFDRPLQLKNAGA